MDRITEEQVRRSKNLQSQLLWLIANRYNNSWTFVQPKREAFRRRQLLLTKPWTFQTDYIKIYTALQQRKAFIATYKAEEFAANFVWREIGDDVRAAKLNMTASYDAEAMWKDNKDYFRLSNLHDYWVGIRISTWRDANKKVMKYDVVNPEYWMPDPLGNSVDNNFEYHMFLMQSTLDSLHNVNHGTPWTYFNLDKVATTALADDMDWREYQKQAERLLSREEDWTRLVWLLNTYIEINWRKYLITTSNSRWLIIRFKEIEPQTTEERKNPSLVPFPVNITNVIPLQEDPFWIAPLELIIDKQWAQNRLMNLAIIQEQQNTFKRYLVDTDIISNVNMLWTRTDKGPIYIPASTSKPAWIGGWITEIPDHQTADASKVNLADKIDMLIQEQTGFTDLNRWIGSPNMTATEAKIQTVNSNLQFQLDATRIAMWERDFRLNMRYREIQIHLTATNKKIFRIQSGLIGRTVELTRNDLLSWIDPDVKIISKRKIKDDNRETFAAMQANLPLVLQNPAIPVVSKNIYTRKLQEMSGMDKEMVMIYTPLSADEHRALAYVDMINNNIMPENLFRPWMDLLTYWIYFNQAEDTETKDKVLGVLEQAMAEEWLSSPQMPQEQGQLQGTANSMASQQTSALIAQQKQQAQQQWIQWGI